MDEPHLRHVLTELDTLEPRARELIAGLDAEQMLAAPPDGGWSIAQIFEHLCIADASYLDEVLPRALAKAQEQDHATRPWKPSLFGGWMRRALDSTDRKLPAPKVYRVGSQVRDGVVEAWLAGLRRLRALLEQASGLDLNTRLSSPVFRLIRMSLGDALAIPVVHAQRHLRQVERTRQALGC